MLYIVTNVCKACGAPNEYRYYMKLEFGEVRLSAVGARLCWVWVLLGQPTLTPDTSDVVKEPLGSNKLTYPMPGVPGRAFRVSENLEMSLAHAWSI